MKTTKVDEQFGYVNNLFIIVSIAIITFMMNLASKNDLQISCFEKSIIISSVICIFISLSFGVYLAWYRIQHYRLGSNVDNKTGDEGIDKENISNYINSEKKKRKFLKREGVFLTIGIFLMFIYTILKFILR